MNFVTGHVVGVPMIVVIWIAVAFIASLLLSATTFGRRIYAVGTNARAAELAGVRVQRVLVVPYVVSAVGAALTGLLLMGFDGQAFLTLGDPYLFFVRRGRGDRRCVDSRPGSGHYAGTIAGAIVLTLVGSLLALFNLGAAWLQIAYGVILLATVYVASLSRAHHERAASQLASSVTEMSDELESQGSFRGGG